MSCLFTRTDGTEIRKEGPSLSPEFVAQVLTGHREPLSADHERIKLRIAAREKEIARLAHENWLDRLELGSD